MITPKNLTIEQIVEIVMTKEPVILPIPHFQAFMLGAEDKRLVFAIDTNLNVDGTHIRLTKWNLGPKKVLHS